MSVATARLVLGVRSTDAWEVVRASYRDRIRIAHPDISGHADDHAAELNAAYRVLAIARREGRLHAPDPAEPPLRSAPSPWVPDADRRGPAAVRHEWPAPSGRPADLRRLARDTIALDSPPPETFRRLVEAAHAVADVSYIDRSCAIFEAVVTLEDGSHGSMVVSLQWRAHDATCEAFFTLEALERAETLDVSTVLDQLIDFVPPDDGDVPFASR